MKKTIFLLSCLSLLTLTACTAPAEGAASSMPTANATPPAASSSMGASSVVESTEIVLEYPAHMERYGHTEAVVLDEMPTRIVCLSNAPIKTLYELGVDILAIPESKTWPDDLINNTQVLTTMADNFSLETVIALDPDFVFTSQTSDDAELLIEAGIPVYRVIDGPSSTYEATKLTTQILVDAFGTDEAKNKAVLDKFTTLEARIAEFKVNSSAGKTIMALHNSPPGTRIQTSEAYLGSMLNLLGFENVNEGAPSSNMVIDMETMIGYDPDYIFAVSSIISPKDYPAESLEYQRLMELGYADNAAYWDTFDALTEGDVFYLPSSYRSSLGIGIVDDINALMDRVEAHEAAK